MDTDSAALSLLRWFAMQCHDGPSGFGCLLKLLLLPFVIGKLMLSCTLYPRNIHTVLLSFVLQWLFYPFLWIHPIPKHTKYNITERVEKFLLFLFKIKQWKSHCNNSTRSTLERRETLGRLRFINPNMINHFAGQSQTYQLLKINFLTLKRNFEKWCNLRLNWCRSTSNLKLPFFKYK